jgi:hypothetical protein
MKENKMLTCRSTLKHPKCSPNVAQIFYPVWLTRDITLFKSERKKKNYSGEITCNKLLKCFPNTEIKLRIMLTHIRMVKNNGITMLWNVNFAKKKKLIIFFHNYDYDGFFDVILEVKNKNIFVYIISLLLYWS